MEHHRIGSSKARAKFSQLLRAVLAGNRYTITLHGKPVADLVPAQPLNRADRVAAVEQMREFMRGAPPIQAAAIKALVNDGRA